MIDLTEALRKNSIILLIIPSEAYSSTVIDLAKQASKKVGSTWLYITLNNPYESLVSMFKEAGISDKKCFFIDGISKAANARITAKNCIFISNPGMLTELSIAITKAVEKIKPELVIFDSLSTLKIYSSINTIIGFTQSLVTKLKANNTSTMFPVIKDPELIKNMAMFVDKVIDMKE